MALGSVVTYLYSVPLPTIQIISSTMLSHFFTSARQSDGLDVAVKDCIG